jgi:hypothetical protein
MSIILNILLVRAELSMQLDGWTDMTKVIFAFRSFEKALKNCQLRNTGINYKNSSTYIIVIKTVG